MTNTKNYTIDRNAIKEDVFNYRLLRQRGLEYISKLSGTIWTDYNIHDPGVTILELLCYAITDLGYRTSFDIKDILTPPGDDCPETDYSFIPAEKILASNPITTEDYRKLLIEKIPELRNIWLKPKDKEFRIPKDCLVSGKTNTSEYVVVKLKGFYKIIADVEGDKKLQNHIWKQFLSTRNLCEDIEEVVILDKVDIGICADIKVKSDIAYEPILREINKRMRSYINNNRTSSVKKEQLNISDAINLIMDISGVTDVRHFHFVPATGTRGLYFETDTRYSLMLTEESRDLYAFNFDCSLNEIVVTRGLLSFRVGNLPNSSIQNDIETPESEVGLHSLSGRNRELDRYISIQDEFPKIYQLGREGIADSATSARKAQRLQLKAYLAFFDQLLADYLSQLDSVKYLVSWRKSVKNTYSYKKLSDLEIADFEKVVPSYKRDISGRGRSYIGIVDPIDIRKERKNRFLNHLLARFNEEFVNYSVLNFTNRGQMDRNSELDEMINDKIAFLDSYAYISGNRSQATDYTKDKIVYINGKPDHVRDRIAPSVLESRIYIKLGLNVNNVGLRLSNIRTEETPESYNTHFGVHLYEHILLRPLDGEVDYNNFIRLTEEIDQGAIVKDPYSMRITVVAPGWLKMSEDFNFRKFVEQTIRMEIPAHIAVKICWLNIAQMKALEDAYAMFRDTMEQVTYPGNKTKAWKANYNTLLTALVKIFSSLRSVYPPLQLYTSNPEITMNYTSAILNHSLLPEEATIKGKNKI